MKWFSQTSQADIKSLGVFLFEVTPAKGGTVFQVDVKIYPNPLDKTRVQCAQKTLKISSDQGKDMLKSCLRELQCVDETGDKQEQYHKGPYISSCIFDVFLYTKYRGATEKLSQGVA